MRAPYRLQLTFEPTDARMQVIWHASDGSSLSSTLESPFGADTALVFHALYLLDQHASPDVPNSQLTRIGAHQRLAAWGFSDGTRLVGDLHLQVSQALLRALANSDAAAALAQSDIGGNQVSISFGDGNRIENSTISIGDVAGGNLTKIVINAPYVPLQELLDHCESTTIFRNQLEGFVGREAEIAEIRARVAEVMPTGGYITITAQAGGGKSSVIAKMVEQDGREQTAFHFIALTPGPKYQFDILRHLTARLIAKHGLSADYFPEQNYLAMRTFFPTVLEELRKRGVQEVIYVDGLDQLEPESNGVRDLSFLPTDPPPGIVIILGSRPGETLDQFNLRHPKVHEHKLQPLTPNDFRAMLQTHQVSISESAVAQIHKALDGNALYLRLAANEVETTADADWATFVQTITTNPQGLFTIALDRIKRTPSPNTPTLWTVVKRVLAVLVVAQESPTTGMLRSILEVDNDGLMDGLSQLGGLVSRSGDRYTLYHLKFREYLMTHSVEQRYGFPANELTQWHTHLANWCVPNPEYERLPWQDDAHADDDDWRLYAQYHYITHLALGRQWKQLCQVVDDGTYGRHKRHIDPSTRRYALDLDRARDYAAEQQDLARLWRWSLLRLRLSSHVDQWPDDLFVAWAYLESTHEALDRVDLLSSIPRKVRLLCRIAEIASLVGSQDALDLWDRARVMATQAAQTAERDEARHELAVAQSEAGQWNAARATIDAIDDMWWRVTTLAAVTAAQRDHPDAAATIDLAWATATSISHPLERAGALAYVGATLIQIGRDRDAEDVVAEIRDIGPDEDLDAEVGWKDRLRRACVSRFVEMRAWDAACAVTLKLGISRGRNTPMREVIAAQAQAGEWELAQRMVDARPARQWRAEALSALAVAQAHAGHTEAKRTFRAAYDVTMAPDEADPDEWGESEPISNRVLRKILEAQAHADQWDAARTTARLLDIAPHHVDVLQALVESQARMSRSKSEIDRQMEVWQREDALQHIIGPPQTETWHEEQASAERAAMGQAIVAAQQGHPEIAWATMRQGGSSRWHIKGPKILMDTYRRTGQWEAAWAIMDRFGTPMWWQELNAHTLVSDQWNAGEQEAAQTRAMGIADPELRAATLYALTVTQTQAGHTAAAATLAAAASAAAALGDLEDHAPILRVRAVALADAGEWEAARTIAATIDNLDTRAEALQAIHSALIRAGEMAAARRGTGEAWRNVQTMDDLIRMATIAMPLIAHDSALGQAMADSFAWVDAQLRHI